MKIHLDLIPGFVQHTAAAGAKFGEKIKADLESNTAIEVETLVDQFFPAAAGLRTELIALCQAGVNTCQKIAAEDWSGVTARLQRVVTDTTSLLHGKKHTISTYIQWCEVVIRDILDGGTGTTNPATQTELPPAATA